MPLAETVHASEHAEHAVDYHVLMGHQPARLLAPRNGWLILKKCCGYCDLLTVSPPLVLALLLALPVVPPVQWLVVLADTATPFASRAQPAPSARTSDPSVYLNQTGSQARDLI